MIDLTAEIDLTTEISLPTEEQRPSKATYTWAEAEQQREGEGL